MADSIAVNVQSTAIHLHAYEGVDGTHRIKCRKCGDETTIGALSSPYEMLEQRGVLPLPQSTDVEWRKEWIGLEGV